jgi:hypothetical protein
MKKTLFSGTAAGEKVQLSIHFFLAPVKKQTPTHSFGYFPDRRTEGKPGLDRRISDVGKCPGKGIHTFLKSCMLF